MINVGTRLTHTFIGKVTHEYIYMHGYLCVCVCVWLTTSIAEPTETTLRTGVSTFEVKLQPLGGASIIIAPISRNVSDGTQLLNFYVENQF